MQCTPALQDRTLTLQYILLKPSRPTTLKLLQNIELASVAIYLVWRI